MIGKLLDKLFPNPDYIVTAIAIIFIVIIIIISQVTKKDDNNIIISDKTISGEIKPKNSPPN